LVCLRPIRALFNLFLSDSDAAQLLRVSRTTALALLPGFTLRQHVFVGESQAQMLRMRALYEAYDMRPTRMCLSSDVRSLSLEEGSGRSPFPSSLTSLLLGPLPPDDGDRVPHPTMFDAEAVICESIDCLWTRLAKPRTRPTRPSSGLCRSTAAYKRMLLERSSMPVHSFAESRGPFNCALPPGLLPHGLRRLQFADGFDSPLLPGSIPSTVEILQLWSFNQPLSVGVLPASLIHLMLVSFNQPLLPGVLPATLERLLNENWNQPLEVGVLPASLRALTMQSFNRPLLPGALPPGLTHCSLDAFDRPLTAGVLPTSLKSFDVGYAYSQPLLPGRHSTRTHPPPSLTRLLR
jgi:hypothetical protein